MEKKKKVGNPKSYASQATAGANKACGGSKPKTGMERAGDKCRSAGGDKK